MQYRKLAALVSKLHQIKLRNYGNLNAGVAEWPTFSGYMYDSLYVYPSKLMDYGLMGVDEVEALRQ